MKWRERNADAPAWGASERLPYYPACQWAGGGYEAVYWSDP